MVTPDSLIESFGEGIAITRVVEHDTGRDGVSEVTREIETTEGVVSSPGEEAEQRLEGRVESGMITVTVPSDTDVRADRDGGRDRLLRPAPDISADALTLWVREGETYTVEAGTTETYQDVRLDGELNLEGEIVLEDGRIEASALTLWVREGETHTVEAGTTEAYRNVRLDGELNLEGEILLGDGRIEIDDGVRAYTIEDVTRDRHPMAGVDKLTLMCSEYGGRKDLENDAETYVESA